VSESPNSEICSRIAKLRLEVAGARGKSIFAKKLGISPSTYDYYETTRVPPAELLVKIAEIADVDLRWLLTGQLGERAVEIDNPLIHRVARLLANAPNAAEPLAAFIDILAESMKFPQTENADSTPQDVPQPAEKCDGTDTEVEKSWIPILGRSVAGIPAFWTENADSDNITTLEQLVDRHILTSRPRDVKPAVASGISQAGQLPVQIITLSDSDDSAGTAEFVASAEFIAKFPDAFALRIDGESMPPEIRHGDIVLLSPSIAGIDGAVAVVQLQNQIGVTCKLLKHPGETIHLMTLNEQYNVTTLTADQLLWSLKVLARVRL